MSEPSAKRNSMRALYGLNFVVADVATGIGPFLAAFLAGRPGWTGTRIGVALSVAGIAGLVLQAPLGIWVDNTRRKRALIATAVVLIAAASLLMTFGVKFYEVLVVQGAFGIAGAAIGPALAAITLGLVGARAFGRVQGTVQAWNHAGNVFAALLIGVIGKYAGLNGALWFIIAMAALSLLALRGIDPADIDHRAARGAGDDQPVAWYAPLRNPNLVALVGAFFLFHFANAAMLPLAGMKLGHGNPDNAAPYMSACIVGAQLVMVPIAALAGPLSDRFGWKPILAIGFGVLALRGILYPLSDNAAWIIGVQLLDGIGAGLFGVLGIVAVAELTEGSGRFNAAQGLATTFVGIGATVSTVVAGWMVDRFGYGFAFITLAVLAGVALLVLMFCVQAAAPRARTMRTAASATN